jgi:two-component sensor histidine kinase
MPAACNRTITMKRDRRQARAPRDAAVWAEAPTDFARGDLTLVLGEVNHRMRNLLAVVEAMVRQTRSATVEDYRAKVMARLSGFRGLQWVIDRSDGNTISLAELIEQTMRPYCADGAEVLAAGPDLSVEPRLAIALHLVFHELAVNATKFGALSAPGGSVTIRWEMRKTSGVARQLAIVWTEHGGPKVARPRGRGFGSRLFTRALASHGEVQLEFKSTGLVCGMLIDLDRAAV